MNEKQTYTFMFWKEQRNKLIHKRELDQWIKIRFSLIDRILIQLRILK